MYVFVQRHKADIQNVKFRDLGRTDKKIEVKDGVDLEEAGFIDNACMKFSEVAEVRGFVCNSVADGDLSFTQATQISSTTTLSIWTMRSLLSSHLISFWPGSDFESELTFQMEDIGLRRRYRGAQQHDQRHESREKFCYVIRFVLCAMNDLVIRSSAINCEPQMPSAIPSVVLLEKFEMVDQYWETTVQASQPEHFYCWNWLVSFQK